MNKTDVTKILATGTDKIYLDENFSLTPTIQSIKTYEIDFTKVKKLKDIIDILKVFNITYTGFSTKDVEDIKHLLKEKE